MGYLVAAYSIIWGFIFFYTLILGKRQRKLMHEIELLQRAIQGKKE
ncbi:CcmD family protein [Calderihabitans maritimus]|uniref:CcmD family protein n=1 Tax=Calderihabitans maritimus TaxID=1246530 RepID=A0A1Z5HW26_9FIRM|nr:CcmD family protein [Calderihabitans maritimus]GAW93743.1 hypothetical protein KKC1_28710 [Calderihabitans maritimus]